MSWFDKEALKRSLDKPLDLQDSYLDYLKNSMSKSLSNMNVDKALSNLSSAVGIVDHAADVYQRASDWSASRRARDAAEDIAAAGSGRKEPAIEYKEGSKTPKRGTYTYSPQSNPGVDQLMLKPFGIGNEHVAVSGNNWLTPININLGKRESRSSESIKNFLSLISGSGKVCTSFGGRLLAPVDKRVHTFQMFRHNLHASDSVNDSGPYPGTAKIMNPSGTLDLRFDTPYVSTNVLLNAPITTVEDGSVWWAPLNRSDYEDMSWNLNRCKVARVDVSGTGGVFQSVFQPDAARWQDNAHHRLNSEIYLNNDTTAHVNDDPPYRYNMVFQQGYLNYVLMNKGPGPLTVELIVYRIKKRGNATLDSSFDNFDIKHTLINPIKEGFTDKQQAKNGTDLLNGHAPHGSDCVDNPAYPFLPFSRYTRTSEIPFTESQRVKVVVPSGAHRPVRIKLGGDVYDPANVVGQMSHSTKTRSIVDSHSYMVCLAVNGTQVTRELKPGNQQFANNAYTFDGINIGDMYGSADLQWYMQYTEEIEAAAYKKNDNSKIVVAGNLPEMATALAVHNNDPTKEDLWTTPVTMLPQDKTVRVSESVSRTRYGTAGASSSNADYSTKSASTSSSCGPSTLQT